ncbi:hypothetical protein [Nonomuraea typhae]|uniref:Helix-turn-helix domain-containing protein n=1 Tax=Nonomuraea typhae TaxID=2603600 RepID=A0ABW7Z6B0_9ACTN
MTAVANALCPPGAPAGGGAPVSGSARRNHLQVPVALLRSPAHGALAVAAWAMYETLMPRALGGGRAPAYARRCWVAEALGVNEKTLDGARRELLAADVAGGPWLARSSPRGAKRAVRHMALRLPSKTREPHAAVPAWTLDLLSASGVSGRRICPAAWRLYALVLGACGEADELLETSVGHLGDLLGASADTGRRRLRELERAGLAEVTQRRGGRLLVRPVLDPDEAAVAAVTFVTQGRQHTTSPSHSRALTPGRTGHSPLAEPGSPQKAPVPKTSQLDASRPPAAGDLQVVGGLAPKAGSKKSSTRTKTPRQPRDAAMARQAAEVYRHAIPQKLAEAIPAFGRQRVLAAIAAELAHRTTAELAERIGQRWQHWRWRDDITDPAAVAITIVRRGYDCPDVRCEDQHRLDTGQPCQACAETAAQITRSRLDNPQQADQPPPPAPDAPSVRAPQGVDRGRDPASPPPVPCAAAGAGVQAKPSSGPPSQAWAEAIRRRDYGKARAVLDDDGRRSS